MEAGLDCLLVQRFAGQHPDRLEGEADMLGQQLAGQIGIAREHRLEQGFVLGVDVAR